MLAMLNEVIDNVIDDLVNTDRGGLDEIKACIFREMDSAVPDWKFIDYDYVFREVLFGLEKQKMLATVICRKERDMYLENSMLLPTAHDDRYDNMWTDWWDDEMDSIEDGIKSLTDDFGNDLPEDAFKLGELIDEEIDIDVYDDYDERCAIAFVGPIELTKEGKDRFESLLKLWCWYVDSSLFGKHLVVRCNYEDDAELLKEFMWSAAGYCGIDEYDRWFK